MTAARTTLAKVRTLASVLGLLLVTGGDQQWATCDLRVAFVPFR